MPPEVQGSHAWLLALALIVAALFYLRGWVQLRTSLRNWRLTAFMGGVLALWAATGSPLAALDHEFLTVHMVQHLILMTLAAPLILLGSPVLAFERGLPRAFVDRVVGPLLKSPPVRAVGRTISHPVFCWLASTGVVIGWHTPGLFAIGMHSEAWHVVEHASFFGAGLLFWWPVIQPWPSLARWPQWSIPVYLFLATLPCDALSAFLTFCNRVVYAHYDAAPGLFGSPLGDQECAGALMWVTVTFAYLAPAIAITMRMLSPQRVASKAEVF